MMEMFTMLVGIISSVFLIYKLVVDVVLSKSLRRRDEYSFTKQYMADLHGNREHQYTLEKGFFALTGKIYTIKEIKILLFQVAPSHAINLRNASDSFIYFDTKLSLYRWKGKYSKAFRQRLASKYFFMMYIITASLAFFPIFFKGVFLLATIPVATYTVSLLIIAINFLIKQSDFKNAKKFMKQIKYLNT